MIKIILTSKTFYEQLKELVEKQPTTYSTLLKSHEELKPLLNFVYQQTPLLNESYTIPTRVYWVLNNLTDFPKCSVCGKKMENRNVSLNVGYSAVCSRKCSGRSPARLNKVKQTCEKKYGNKNYRNVDKAKKTRESFSQDKRNSIKSKIHNTIEKNKRENPNYIEEIKQKRHETNMKRHGSSTWNNSEQRKKTCMQKYNVENVFASEKIKDKIRKTNMENLGVEMPMQSQNVRKKSQKTKYDKYGDPNFTNREKAAKTCLDKYGNICYLASDEGKERKKQTNLKKYNVECTFQSEKVKDKIKKTNIEKYGAENVFASKEIQNKIKNTLLDRYGVDHPSKCKYVNDKMQKGRQKTCMQKYGSDSYWGSEQWKKVCMEKFGGLSPSCDPEIQKKQFHRYKFDNTLFDSSYELAAYIFFKDHGITFKFHDFKGIPYEFDGNKFLYFRDFDVLIDGTWRMFEIKGDHFFNAEGKMICPFRNENWTDEFYEYVCAKYEAKHQCMLKNDVIILLTSGKECNMFMSYVKNTYGNNYIQTFKCNQH